MTWLHILLNIPSEKIDSIDIMVFLFLGSVLFLFSYLAQEEQLKPQEQYPELFKAVQSQGIFPDSKTFPDCIPVLAPALIREAYNSEKDKPDFDLKAFVLQNFKLPATPAANFTSDTSLPVTEHINKLWPLLTRQAINDFSSRIHLPNPYLVPGGRFREIYYWDSYFGMLGLQVNGDYQLIEEMVDNFTFLIESVGHIPNGNRSYYTTRSQPPFYALMLQTLSEIKGEEVWLKYGPALKKEYHFWMDGSNNLSEEKPTYRRSVRMPDGCILNRYWDDCPDPRPESYIEDVHLARLSDQRPEDLYRHIRAAAESGWDFSSRWFADSQTMKTIHTTDIIPVDLNALLYNVEMTLAHIVQLENNPEQAEHYKDLAHKRKKTLLRYCWSTKENFFMDYDMVQRHNTPTFSLAACFPLYFNMVLPKQANCVAEKLEKDFFKPGGLITTLNHTPEQWDAPNAWAPLQYISIVALRNYGYHELAEKIKNNWIQLNIEVFKATGKLVEKYNVENSEAEAGGGEYPLQDGFGWTNGVLLKLLSEGKEETTEQGKKDASEGATAQESVPASPA